MYGVVLFPAEVAFFMGSFGSDFDVKVTVIDCSDALREKSEVNFCNNCAMFVSRVQLQDDTTTVSSLYKCSKYCRNE